MTASIDRDLLLALIVRPEQVRRIWAQLDKQYDRVEATIRCADEIERTFSSVDDLLNYENSVPRQIQRLKIEGHRHSGPIYTRAVISFEHRFGKTLNITISGDETDISALYDRLLDIVQGMKPWYSAVAVADFIEIGMALLVSGFMLTLMYTNEYPAPEGYKPASIIVLGVVSALLTLVLLIRDLATKSFPPITFAIGQGQIRLATAENVRWAVIIGSLVSIGTAVFLSMVMH